MTSSSADGRARARRLCSLALALALVAATGAGPAAAQTLFQGRIGTIDQPFVAPGNQLTIRRRSCDEGSEFDPAKKTVVREGEKTGRNDPCPCGSGKKYKKCHGA